MTESHEDVTSLEEFKQRLSDLISRADENGVDVEGDWTFESEADGETWDVVISLLDGEDPNGSDVFQQRLDALVSAAAENGVDIAGGWTCETNPGGEVWDVVATKVERDDTAE